MVKGSGGADKFVSSNLDAGLKEKGIKTVIVTGTSAQGAVAGTTNGAAQRGYKAVVPVDGLSAEDAFNELYAVWHIAKGGPVNLTSNATATVTSRRPSRVAPGSALAAIWASRISLSISLSACQASICSS